MSDVSTPRFSQPDGGKEPRLEAIERDFYTLLRGVIDVVPSLMNDLYICERDPIIGKVEGIENFALELATRYGVAS